MVQEQISPGPFRCPRSFTSTSIYGADSPDHSSNSRTMTTIVMVIIREGTVTDPLNPIIPIAALMRLLSTGQGGCPNTSCECPRHGEHSE